MRFMIALCAALLCFGLAGASGTAQTAGVSGKWHFVFQTDDGERNFDATFQQDGDKVTGKWGDADVQGTFADGKLNLEFPFNSEVGPGTLKMNGQLAEGALSGNWEFQASGGNYTGTFKGSKSA
jgi:hypothetical protein